MCYVVVPTIVKEFVDLENFHVVVSMPDVIIQHGSKLGGITLPTTPRSSSYVPLG